jgi:hypothetical protein
MMKHLFPSAIAQESESEIGLHFLYELQEKFISIPGLQRVVPLPTFLKSAVPCTPLNFFILLFSLLLDVPNYVTVTSRN